MVGPSQLFLPITHGLRLRFQESKIHKHLACISNSQHEIYQKLIETQSNCNIQTTIKMLSSAIDQAPFASAGRVQAPALKPHRRTAT